MGKYFGTDGIRGVAGTELSCTLAYKAGAAAAFVLGAELSHRPLFIIGRDTRASGDMISAALRAGLLAFGADVCDLGVIPTPAVAFHTAESAADAGVVISASHNSFEYNGIKIFGGAGYKLTDAEEELIERYIEEPLAQALCGGALGRVREWDGDPAEQYVEHVAGASAQMRGMRVLVDCANGAACRTAPLIFRRLGAQADFMADAPDGININDNCGSTNLAALCAAVKAGGYEAGVAFDGDADRCLMVDENGEPIDGDRMIGSLAAYMRECGRLRGGAVVTVMSNLGLHEYLKSLGIASRVTAVGDRYVLEDMLASGCNIGGEQSGHIIMTDYCTTGDGEMTAVQMLSLLKSKGIRASALSNIIKSFPQVMINVEVSNALKKQVAALPEVAAISEEIENIFGDAGRILIRPSGTEAKVRVMVEGKEKEKVSELARRAAEVIRAAALK